MKGLNLQETSTSLFAWLNELMQAHGLLTWGAADLRGFSTPRDETGHQFPVAVSFIIPVDPSIMVEVRGGPNQAYADEYARINARLNELGVSIAESIKSRGHRAQSLAASERTDTVNIKGDFPHKTAATRAGLGWIGKHCQLITYKYGSWVRLGTVFTNMDLPCGPSVERNFCGKCSQCVEACPAHALAGGSWSPGIPRETMLDARRCDNFKKEFYPQYHGGHVCGICSAVCPHSIKAFRRR
jgi:epoxyqueuosine reductase